MNTYDLNKTTWIRITDAGESGVCWSPKVGSGFIALSHTSTGGEDSYTVGSAEAIAAGLDKSIIYPIRSRFETAFIPAVGNFDCYYALLVNTNDVETATLFFDECINGNPLVYTSYGALVTEPITNRKVELGQAFGLSKRITIIAGSTLNIVVDPTGLDSSSKLVFLPISFKGLGGGPVKIDYYIDSVYTDGTELGYINYNDVSGNTGLLEWYQDPTFSDYGTLSDFESELFTASSGPSEKIEVGAAATEALISIKDPTRILRFLLTNTDADNDVALLVTANWFEISP